MQLDEALVSLKENVPGTSLDDRGNYKIYYIQGSGLDMTGRATRWMFGINSSTGSKLMISDYSGWSNIPWSARLPDNEIQIDKIISPTDLLKKNSITITPNPSEGASDYRELDLREGVYSITVTSAGSTRYLTFNAITGEPVVLQ